MFNLVLVVKQTDIIELLNVLFKEVCAEVLDILEYFGL